MMVINPDAASLYTCSNYSHKVSIARHAAQCGAKMNEIQMLMRCSTSDVAHYLKEGLALGHAASAVSSATPPLGRQARIHLNV